MIRPLVIYIIVAEIVAGSIYMHLKRKVDATYLDKLVIQRSMDRLEIMANQDRFIPVHGHTQRYCLHDGEIGQSKGTRYCLNGKGDR